MSTLEFQIEKNPTDNTKIYKCKSPRAKICDTDFIKNWGRTTTAKNREDFIFGMSDDIRKYAGLLQSAGKVTEEESKLSQIQLKERYDSRSILTQDFLGLQQPNQNIRAREDFFASLPRDSNKHADNKLITDPKMLLLSKQKDFLSGWDKSHFSVQNTKDRYNAKNKVVTEKMVTRAACKYLIHYIISNNGIIHYALDSLYVGAVIVKAQIGDDVPICTSEIRELQKRWNQYKNNVKFYTEFKELSEKEVHDLVFFGIQKAKELGLRTRTSMTI